MQCHKILHRDLKPANILIIREQDEFIPLIADFGLSKQARVGPDQLVSNTLTAGTLPSAAPEQLLGHTIRMNADLWSLGVILYELFAGTQPFHPQSAQLSSTAQELEIREKILKAELPPDLQKIPSPWREMIQSFLIKDPEMRAQGISSQVLDQTVLDNSISVPKEDVTLILREENKEVRTQNFNQNESLNNFYLFKKINYFEWILILTFCFIVVKLINKN